MNGWIFGIDVWVDGWMDEWIYAVDIEIIYDVMWIITTVQG